MMDNISQETIPSETIRKRLAQVDYFRLDHSMQTIPGDCSNFQSCEENIQWKQFGTSDPTRHTPFQPLVSQVFPLLCEVMALIGYLMAGRGGGPGPLPLTSRCQ